MRRLVTSVLGVGLAAALAGPVVFDLWRRPVESVRVTGPFVHVSKPALEGSLEPLLSRPFLALDVSAIRRAARTMPWVKDVSVRMVWPGRLDVEVTERHAVASWRERRLLESDGSLFEPASPDHAAALPALAGPPGRHLEVLERYQALDRIVRTRLHTRVARLERDAHGAWAAELANGITLRLGSDPFERRAARYVRAFPKTLGPRLAEVQEVDLRYGNGFAVRWRSGEGTEGVEA